MRPIGNDRWQGQFQVTQLGQYLYTVQAWVDTFQTWTRDLLKKYDAGQDVSVDLLAGAELVRAAADPARGADAIELADFASQLTQLSLSKDRPPIELIRNADRAGSMARYPDRSAATTYPNELRVVVDREKARFSSWYEMFPRSCTTDASRHGTFRDCHPQLGTLEDFKALQIKASERGLEIALDIAFQCSPDHPYVREHEEWFRHRPDGTIQYAENPPKKYEDIYPFYFENEHVRSLCEELKSVVLYWTERGIMIFRVDNPHTKPFDFWERLIEEVQRDHPGVIFLAEAFTRPKVMYRLAKLGFTQSYTYFAWKNTKWEITQYFTELPQPPVSKFFRGNLWPNTPDILTDYLRQGGPPAFISRLVLVISRIPDLKSLGITAIEIMPVAQFPGTRNWGYDGVYPFAVQDSYGGPAGLKRLVSACHEQGMAVVLDVVYKPPRAGRELPFGFRILLHRYVQDAVGLGPEFRAGA
jgi:starch synthase (maltosyl-transferring)